MKIMILTDLEGPCGVNGRSDGIGNTMHNATTAQQALVNEVNACCAGLFEAGADEVIVMDGHGGSDSIDIFKLHPRAKLMQVGLWRPVTYMDASFDAVVQLGAHAMQSSGGYMCHTFNSHGIAELCMNGEQIGEIGFAGMLASYFRVPTILVSGDEDACKEAKAFFGDSVRTVATKSGLNRYAAINYPPQEVYENLRKVSAEALKNIKNIPYRPLPAQLEMRERFMSPNVADYMEQIGIQRLDEVTMLYRSDDFVEIMAQRQGWAPGVHQKKYGITPDWKFPPFQC